MISTSISPRLEVKVRMTVESRDSYIAEIGTSAGDLGLPPGSMSGKGLMITVSATFTCGLSVMIVLPWDMIDRESVPKIIRNKFFSMVIGY